MERENGREVDYTLQSTELIPYLNSNGNMVDASTSRKQAS